MHSEENNMPLASEMYTDLKDTNKFLRKLLVSSFIIILILIVGLCATNIYHIHKWSQFETIVVDSESGPANYVQGDNGVGIYNGPGYSPSEEIWSGEGDSNQEGDQQGQ